MTDKKDLNYYFQMQETRNRVLASFDKMQNQKNKRVREFIAKTNRRKNISAGLRWEILRRDRFTCIFCGAKAPFTALTVDHVIPVCKGGTNDKFNLVTACAACQYGKSDRV